MNPADNDDGRKRKPEQDEPTLSGRESTFAGMKTYIPQGSYEMYEGRSMPTADLMYAQKSVSNAEYLTSGAEEESFGSKKRKMNIPKQAIQVPTFGAAVSPQRTEEVTVKSNTSWFESNQNVFRKSSDVSVESQVHPSISLQRQGHMPSEVQQTNVSNQRQIYQSSTVVQQFEQQQQSSDGSPNKQFQSNVNVQSQIYSGTVQQLDRQQQLQQQQQQQQLLQQQKQQQMREQQKQQLQQRQQQQQQQMLQQQKLQQEQQLKQQQLQEEKLRQEQEQEQQLQQQRLQQQQLQQQQLLQQREQQQKQLQEEKLRQEREQEQQLQQQRLQQQQLQQQQLQQQQLQQQQQQQQKQLQEEKLRQEREQEQILQQQLQQQREQQQKQLQEEKLQQQREQEQQLQQQRLQQQQLQQQQEQQQKELEQERVRQEQEREQQIQQQRLQQQLMQQQQLQKQQEQQQKQLEEEKLRQEQEQEQRLQQQRLQQQQLQQQQEQQQKELELERLRQAQEQEQLLQKQRLQQQQLQEQQQQQQQLLQQQEQERQRQQQEQQQQELQKQLQQQQQQQLLQQQKQQQEEEERKQQQLQEENERQEREQEQQLKQQRLQLLQQQQQKRVDQQQQQQQHVHVSSSTTQSTISSALKSGFNIAASLNPSLGDKVCTKESQHSSGGDHSIASALKGTFAAAAAPMPQVYSGSNLMQKSTEAAVEESDTGGYGLLSAMKNVYDAVTGTTVPQPVVSSGSTIGAALKGMGKIGTAMIVPPTGHKQPMPVSETPLVEAEAAPSARQVPMTHTASLIANIVNPPKTSVPIAVPVAHQSEPDPVPEYIHEKDVIDFTIQGSDEEESGSDDLTTLVESGSESEILESGGEIVETPVEIPVESRVGDTDTPEASVDTPMETPVDSPVDTDNEVLMDAAVTVSTETSVEKPKKKISPVIHEVVFMDEGEDDADEPSKSAPSRKRKKKARKDAEERPKIYNARTRKRDCVKLHEIFMKNIDFIMSPPPPPKKTPVKSAKTPNKHTEAGDSIPKGKLKFTAIQSPSKKTGATPKPSTTPAVQKNDLKRKNSAAKVTPTAPVDGKPSKSKVTTPAKPLRAKASKTQVAKVTPAKKAKLSKEKPVTKITTKAAKKVTKPTTPSTKKVTKPTTPSTKKVTKPTTPSTKKVTKPTTSSTKKVTKPAKTTKTATTATKKVAKMKLEAAKKIALKKKAGTRQYHQYEERDRVKIGKYASEHSTLKALEKFSPAYPELVLPTVYSFKVKYENNQLSAGPAGKNIKTKKPVLTGASKIMKAKKRNKTVKIVVVKTKGEQRAKLAKAKITQPKKTAVSSKVVVVKTKVEQRAKLSKAKIAQPKKTAVSKPGNIKITIKKAPAQKKEIDKKKTVPKPVGKRLQQRPAVDSSHRIRRKYTGEERYKMGKYASEHGVKACALKYMQPGDLRLSTIGDFRTLYERELKLAAKENRAPSKSLMGLEKKGHPRVNKVPPQVAKIKKGDKAKKESAKPKTLLKSKKVVQKSEIKYKNVTTKKVATKHKKPIVKKGAIKDKSKTKKVVSKDKSTPLKLTLKVVPKKKDKKDKHKATSSKTKDAKMPKTSKPFKKTLPKKSMKADGKKAISTETTKKTKKPILKKTILKRPGKGKYKPEYSWLSRFKDFYLVENDRPSSSGGSETSSDGIPATAEPKRFTHAQVVELERVFTTQKYITTDESKKIARKLKVGSDQVTKWFNNRRKKWKKVISELETEVKQKQEQSSQ